MSHGNARTTMHGRLLIVTRHRQGWRQAHIAAAMGVSRRCVKKWLDRFASEGMAGLQDRSSRPHRMPTRTAAPVETQVVMLREQERRGRDWIAAELGVPARTVSRILARHQLPHLAMLDPMTGLVIRASKTTAVRYERDRPGELVHMDVKKLGRIPDGGGHRALGRVTGTPRNRGGGYDYLHVAVDDMSRVAYVAPFGDERGTTCARFLLDAAAFFAGHGVRIERVLTDNARNYTASHAFASALRAIGARHRRTRPYRPQTNGKAERFNQTLLREWAYVRRYDTNGARLDALPRFVADYNERRGHGSLGGRTPMSVLVNNVSGNHT